MFCNKCGSPHRKDALFCPKCGQLIEVDEITSSSFKRKPWLFGIIGLIFVAIVGFSYVFFFSIQPMSSAPETDKTNSKTIEQAKLVEAKKTGYIKGNDVALREDHTIAAHAPTYLKDKQSLNIIGEWTCTDPKEAIVRDHGTLMWHNGKNITLQKGQAVVIQEDLGNEYHIMVNLDNSWIDTYTEKSLIRKIYGEKWIQVSLPNGQIGWVFSDYVVKD